MIGTIILRLRFKYQKDLWLDVYERLGPLEKAILEVFKRLRYQNKREIGSVKGLSRLLLGLGLIEEPPSNFYKSVCRAVDSLERKNYLKTEFWNLQLYDKDEKVYGKNRRYKTIAIGPKMYEKKEWLRWYKRKIP